MQYNNSNGAGLIQDVYFGVSTNGTAFPIGDITRSINNGLDKVSALILRADNRWQFDDLNNVTLPIATTDLINNQQDYSFDDSFLEVVKVLVSDDSGNFRPIYNIDVHDQDVYSYLENKTENVSIPYRYDVVGGSVMLDPRPNYNYTAGLKVYFKRKAEYFTTTDTTKEPGFASQFHRILSLYAQLDYAVAKGLNKVEQIKREILEMEKAISAHYSRRLKDYKFRMIPKYRNPA